MGERQEGSELIQYAVIVKKSNFPYRRYIWVSESAIAEALKPYTFIGGTLGTKHMIDMIPIVFEGNPDDIKKSKKSARVEFIQGRIGSLELHVDTQEDAIKCLEYLKLR